MQNCCPSLLKSCWHTEGSETMKLLRRDSLACVWWTADRMKETCPRPNCDSFTPVGCQILNIFKYFHPQPGFYPHTVSITQEWTDTFLQYSLCDKLTINYFTLKSLYTHTVEKPTRLWFIFFIFLYIRRMQISLCKYLYLYMLMHIVSSGYI